MSEIRSGSNSNLITPRDFGTNCLNSFLEEIADEITGACKTYKSKEDNYDFK